MTKRMGIGAVGRLAAASAIAAGAFVAVTAQGSPPATPAPGDPQKGKVLFLQCAACHSVDPSGVNKVGPNLHAVFGRPVGTAKGFAYSPAFADARKKGLHWDGKALDAFIASPRTFLPGNGMTFGGVADPARRADIVAYLKSQSS